MFVLPGPSRGSATMFPKSGMKSGPGILLICRTERERSHLQYQTMRTTKKNTKRFSMSIEKSKIDCVNFTELREEIVGDWKTKPVTLNFRRRLKCTPQKRGKSYVLFYYL